MKPTPCYCTQSRRLSHGLTEFYDDALAPSGLNVTQFALLRAIAHLDAPTATSLAEATGRDRSTLGRNLRVLERDGAVEMARGGDERTRVVRLTQDGRAAMMRAEPLWKQTQARIDAALTDADRAALAAIAGTIATLHREGKHA